MRQTRRTLNLLMIEDSNDDEALVRLALEEAGYSVSMTRVDSRQALEAKLAGAAWDAILCDHNLPAFDSIQALEVVRAAGLATPFVILSGSIADELAIEAMRRGARDFIRKDMLNRLVPVLERELDTAALALEVDRLSSDIDRLADFDRLTGLPNREHLLRHLSQLAAAGDAERGRAGLLVADINRFRRIGHSLGAAAANEVIAEVARRIAAVAGPDDFVARIGGDSFALVCRDAADEAAAHALVQELVRQAGQPLRVGGYELFMTLSIGAACFPDGVENIENLFAAAEAALFRAKMAGGGSYRIFRPDMALAGERAIMIAGALHRALANREFVLHYQPQIDLASGRIVSVEALLRWQHPALGLVSPLEFIPLLEQSGLIVPVGAWIIDAACDQLRAWQDAGLEPIRMAVNLSALQFGDPQLTGIVAEALRRNCVAPPRLELEITEGIVMEAKDEAIAALQALRRLGVRIAVDDFGTGYSSLGYLKRFPITTLKIDQLFVRDCHESAQDQALIEAMIAMGHRLELEIVAEGVELAQHAEFLAAHGCELAQGYLFGKPVPADAIAGLLRQAAPSDSPSTVDSESRTAAALSRECHDAAPACLGA